MKTQKPNRLEFRKKDLVELSSGQLKTIVGGTNSIIHSSMPCWNEVIRQSSLRCQDSIFNDGF